MTDFEDRLTTALTTGAAAAPQVHGTADGARAQLRRRRHRRAAVGAVLAVLAIVVPLGVAGLDRRADQPPSGTPGADDGWVTRTEQGITFEEPQAWLASSAGSVQVSDGSTSFSPVRESGTTWVGTASPDGVDAHLVVEAPSRAEAQRVVDSAYDGCAPDAAFAAGADEEPALASVTQPSSATICVYPFRGDGTPTVRRLDASDAEALLTALLAGPVATVNGPIPCGPPPRGARHEVGIRFGTVQVWADTGACLTGGLHDGRDERALSQPARDMIGLADPAGVSTVVTRTYRGVAIDLPSSWGPLDPTACPGRNGPVFGPPSIEGCRDRPGVLVYPASTFDPATAPGLRPDDLDRVGWSGYAVAGDVAVYVRGAGDRADGQRILDSVRPADDWQDVAIGDLVLQVPPDWVRLDCGLTGADFGMPATAPCGGGNEVAVFSNRAVDEVYAPTDGPCAVGWCATSLVGSDVVQVRAADEATARRILDSVAALDGTWHTETADGVSIDVPPGCHLGDHRGRAPCYQLEVAPAHHEGVDPPTGAAGLASAYVEVGDHAVRIVGDDPADVRRMLASARPAGEPGVDLTRGWTTVEAAGYRVEVPIGVTGVSVTSEPATDATRYRRTLARPTESGSWVARLSTGLAPTDDVLVVEAPSQALADVVQANALPVSGSWRSVTVAGRTFAIPSTWTAAPPTRCGGSGQVFVAPGGGVCGSGSLIVTPHVVDHNEPDGVEPCTLWSGPLGYCGWNAVDGVDVTVFYVDRATAVRILGPTRN